MSILTFFVLILIISYFAGLIGSLTGVGGGIIITPILVLFFHIDIQYAMGASLLAVIATSMGASIAFKQNFTNIRIGLLLETAAVTGAIIGALLINLIPQTIITFLFSLILFFSAYSSLKRHEELEQWKTSHPISQYLKLDGTYPINNKMTRYHVQKVPTAFALMGFAGIVSGLLGIGSGILKVLAMDQALRLPYRVSTSTSNFMIGMTASAGVGIYFANGYINPVIVCPVVLGVIVGSLTGAMLLHKIKVLHLRIIFSVLIIIIGIQMLYKSIAGLL